MAKAAKAAGVEPQPDMTFDSDKGALLEELRTERERNVREADMIARGEMEAPAPKPAWDDPFRR